MLQMHDYRLAQLHQRELLREADQRRLAARVNRRDRSNEARSALRLRSPIAR